MNLQQMVDILRSHGMLLTAPTADPVLGGITVDSRRVMPGGAFVALPGVEADGHDFIGAAVAAGAIAVVVERPVSATVPAVPSNCS